MTKPIQRVENPDQSLPPQALVKGAEVRENAVPRDASAYEVSSPGLREVLPPDEQLKIAAGLRALLQPVDLVKHPEKSKLQKSAVRKLLKLGAVDALTEALIISIKKNRPDVFMAVLYQLAPGRGGRRLDLAPFIFADVASFLQKNPDLALKRSTFAYYLTGRWIGIPYAAITESAEGKVVKRGLTAVLKTLDANVRKSDGHKGMTAAHLLGRLLNARTPNIFLKEIKKMRRAIKSGKTSKRDFVALTRAGFALGRPQLNYTVNEHGLLEALTKRPPKFGFVVKKAMPSQQFIAAVLSHSGDIMEREQHYWTLYYRFNKRGQFLITKHLILNGALTIKSAHMSRGIQITDLGFIDDDALQYKLLMDVVFQGGIAVGRNMFVRICANKGRKAFERALDSIIRIATEGSRQRRFKALGVLGTPAAKDAGDKKFAAIKRILRKATMSNDATIARVAARSLAKLELSRSLTSEEKMKWLGADKFGWNQLIPQVKAPAVYRGTTESLKIPAGTAPEDRAAIDWNGDGVIRGSYERYQLWLRVLHKYNRFIHAQNHPKHDSDPAMRRVSLTLKRDLKSLYKMYKHLPQVNLRKKTVRLGNRTFKIRHRLSLGAMKLFAVGEVLSSLQPAVRRRLFDAKNGLGSLEIRFRDVKYAAGVYEGGFHAFTGKRYISMISFANGLVEPSKWIRLAKHELAHAVDAWLAHEFIKGKTCTVQSAIPILSAIKMRVSCKRAVGWYPMHYRSNYPDLKGEFDQVLKRAGGRSTTFALSYASRYKRKNQGKIPKHFSSLYAATNPLEFFAENYTYYQMERSPWTIDFNYPTRDDIRWLSPIHYRYFQELDSWNGKGPVE